MRVLHAGSGDSPWPHWLACGEEIRLDVNPKSKPDVVANLVDIGEIGQFDLVYCCHVLEHLCASEIRKALKEFWRVLKPKGVAFIRVPDLEGIQPTEDVVYMSHNGPITGLDMYYGFQKMVEDSPYMGHRFGFVKETLEKMLAEGEFACVKVQRFLLLNELWATAEK